MTRNGKIARLPYDIREELNRRLRNGKFGPELLDWLNEKRECQEVLGEEFNGRPITKQNLSEWRQGGYEDWLRKEETRQRVQLQMDKAAELENDAGAIADRVATLLEAELAMAMEQLDEIKDPQERWARVKEITRELHRLRREDHHARKLRMAEEQYEQREEEAERKGLLKLQEAVQNKQLVALAHGGGDEAWKWTDWGIRVRHGLPMPHWWTNPQSAEEWSSLMMPYWREEAVKERTSKQEGEGSKIEDGEKRPLKSHARGGRRTQASRSGRKSRAVRPGRTESNQKSGSIGPSPGGSKRVESTKGNGAEEESGDCAEQPSPRSSDAPRALGAPLLAEGPGEMAKQATPSPSKSENENKPPASDCGVNAT